MSTRSAALTVFLLCACGLLVVLAVQSFDRSPAATPTPRPAPADAKPAAPGPGPEAASGGARALARALQPVAADPHDHGHGDAKASVAAEPLVDALLDAPLTDEEKARGVSLVPGGGRVDFKSKTLVLPSEVCLRQGPVELFACAEGGKDHESVLRVRCRPELVNLNLTLFGLKKGPSRPPAGTPPGDRVIVLCEWTLDGKTTTARAEDLIWNAALNRPMDRVGWTYVGSRFVPEHDVETGKPTGRTIFEAVYGRTLLATFLDRAALFETPLPEGVDDSVFMVNEKTVPPRGTPVRLIIRPPMPEEREEMATIEKAVDEQRKARKPHGRSREQANGAPPPKPGEEKKEEKKEEAAPESPK